MNIERGLNNMKKKEKLWENLAKHWMDYAQANGKNCYERTDLSSTGVTKDRVGDDCDDDDDDDDCELLLPGDGGYNVSSVEEECDN